MLDLRALVWGKDVGFAAGASLPPQNVSTWMTAWALGWHFLKTPQSSIPQRMFVHSFEAKWFYWGQISSLPWQCTEAPVWPQWEPEFDHLSSFFWWNCGSPDAGMRVKSTVVSFLSHGEQYPELTQRHSSVLTFQGKAKKKKNRKWKFEACLREPWWKWLPGYVWPRRSALAAIIIRPASNRSFSEA